MLCSRQLMNRVLAGAAVVLLTSATSARAQPGSILHVDDDAPLGGDGLGWVTAYRFLQDALTDAAGGGIIEIRVGQGTYVPDRSDFDPDGSCVPEPCDRTATFQFVNGVVVMGGFAGFGAKDPDERDIELYATILSGDLLGDDGPAFLNNDENSYHVANGSATDATAVLDGLTITAGNANGAGDAHFGGGMFNSFGSPTLINCTFRDNFAGVHDVVPCDCGGGAGMYNADSHPTVVGCTFSGNVALRTCYWEYEGIEFDCGVGGGIYNVASNPTVTNCTFTENTASGGAGMYSLSGSPTVTGCTFTANIGSGAGIYMADGSAVVTGCAFSSNSGTQGGGIRVSRGTPVITDCTFMMNTAFEGGGLYNYDSGITVSDCTFVMNTGIGVGGQGAGLFSWKGIPSITNCAFSLNDAPRGGAMYFHSAGGVVSDCVFDRNGSEQGGALYTIYGDQTVANCTFIGNHARLGGADFDGRGGAVQCGSGRYVFLNCFFARNSADRFGGAINDKGNSAHVNCTFVENAAGATAGGVYNWVADTMVTNCVFWQNSPNQLTNIAPMNVTYSDVQGGWTGAGFHNINADPMFVDAENGDYRLQPGSPCLDAGNNWSVPTDQSDYDEDGNTAELFPLDLDGNPRFVDDPCVDDTGNPDGINPIVDIGAYEFIQDASAIADLNLDGVVGMTDLRILLAFWGPCGGICLGDLDCDGIVAVPDLLTMLANWG